MRGCPRTRIFSTNSVTVFFGMLTESDPRTLSICDTLPKTRVCNACRRSPTASLTITGICLKPTLMRISPTGRFPVKMLLSEDKFTKFSSGSGAAEVLGSGKLIIFRRDESLGSGFKVRFLADYLRKEAPFVLTPKGTVGPWGYVFE